MASNGLALGSSCATCLVEARVGVLRSCGGRHDHSDLSGVVELNDVPPPTCCPWAYPFMWWEPPVGWAAPWRPSVLCRFVGRLSRRHRLGCGSWRAIALLMGWLQSPSKLLLVPTPQASVTIGATYARKGLLSGRWLLSLYFFASSPSSSAQGADGDGVRANQNLETHHQDV